MDGDRRQWWRRALAGLSRRYDLMIVLVVLAALYVFVFRLHLLPLPGGGTLHQALCPSGPHAPRAPASGCSRLAAG